VLNKGSQQKTQLAGDQAKFKFGAQGDLLGYLSGVGDKQRELTKEKQAMQQALYSEAGDMMAASTANKAIGRDKILGSAISGVGGIAKAMGGGDSAMSFKTDSESDGMEVGTPSKLTSSFDYQSNADALGLSDNSYKTPTDLQSIQGGNGYAPTFQGYLDSPAAQEMVGQLAAQGYSPIEAYKRLLQLGFKKR
jgi:hypothetical protein